MSDRTSVFGDFGPERRTHNRRQVIFRRLFLGGILKGRRRGPRRQTDRRNYYVDWYEWKLLVVSMGIFLLSCLDALFTLVLLGSGAEEINVFMAALLESGTRTFVVIKVGITAIALVFLVLHSAFRLMGFLRVRHVLYGIFGNYILVFCYQLSLLARAL